MFRGAATGELVACCLKFPYPVVPTSLACLGALGARESLSYELVGKIRAILNETEDYGYCMVKTTKCL